MPRHAPGEQPRAASAALDTSSPREAEAPPPPPPLDVDASQGTATKLAGLSDDDAGALSPPEPPQPAVMSDDDPRPQVAGPINSPTGEVSPHESRLGALIADTALEEANPCRAMDAAVLLDSERLSAVGRRMRAAGQDTTPLTGPHSSEVDAPPPLLAQYAKRTRGLHLGGPLLLPLQLEGRCHPGPSPAGTWDHGILRDRGEGAAPPPHPRGRHAPRVVAPGHGICVFLVCPAPASGGPPGYPGPGVGMPVPGACPTGCPGDRPPPPQVQMCVKRGDRYAPVDTAGMDLGDHRATLTPPGGKPLVIATPMVAKATYDKTRRGLVLIPSALRA